MNRKKLKNAPWYSYAVAACIAVVLFVLLMKLSDVMRGVRTFFGYFRPVILGAIIAYIVNPLAKFFARTLFSKVKKEKIQLMFSNTLAFIFVLLLLVFFALVLIPQLVDSIVRFVNNLDGYIASVTGMLERWGIASRFDVSSFISSSENLFDKVADYLKQNVSRILEISANAGKGLLRWGIAFFLSIYLLANKKNLKAGLAQLFSTMLGEQRYAGFSVFIQKCDRICNRYIVYNLIDSLIIGISTAIFMAAFGMQYVGLIAFVVAVTNLVPTFGPIVGAAIGAFILLMVKPMHTLIFLIFTLVLQMLDGYVIKPKLFGNSLGVSGLWILVGIIVGGNMFGVVGILLAIPAVAILDFIYAGYFLPWLGRRREKKDVKCTDEAAPEENGGE